MNFTLRLPPNEEAIISHYCALTGRTKTDVIREFVRSLDQKNWFLEGNQQPLSEPLKPQSWDEWSVDNLW